MKTQFKVYQESALCYAPENSNKGNILSVNLKGLTHLKDGDIVFFPAHSFPAMQTHTTTTDNTAALIEEFFDGIGISTHRDGETVYVRNENENEILLVEDQPIEEFAANIFLIAGNTEENRTDLEMLLDRWDFSE